MGSTIESVVKNKAAGFNAGSNAMYEPVKRDSCVLYNTGDIANIGVVAYNNTRVVSNTGTTLYTVERDRGVSYNTGVVAYTNTRVKNKFGLKCFLDDFKCYKPFIYFLWKIEPSLTPPPLVYFFIFFETLPY